VAITVSVNRKIYCHSVLILALHCTAWIYETSLDWPIKFLLITLSFVSCFLMFSYTLLTVLITSWLRVINH